MGFSIGLIYDFYLHSGKEEGTDIKFTVLQNMQQLLPNYTNTSPTTSIINCMVQYSTPLAIFGNERHLCSRYYQYEPRDVPDNLKKQEICDKAVRGDPSSLQFIPDWFVTKEDIDLWHDYVYSDWGVSKLYDGYQKRKAQKASVKEELMPIAWNPSRWWDWCVPEDEKKETEKLWKEQVVVLKNCLMCRD